MSRFASRKFITTLAAQIAALMVLMWPQHESSIVATVDAAAALIVALGAALGYVTSEASIDRARVERADQPGGS